MSEKEQESWIRQVDDATRQVVRSLSAEVARRFPLLAPGEARAMLLRAAEWAKEHRDQVQGEVADHLLGMVERFHKKLAERVALERPKRAASGPDTQQGEGVIA